MRTRTSKADRTKVFQHPHRVSGLRQLQVQLIVVPRDALVPKDCTNISYNASRPRLHDVNDRRPYPITLVMSSNHQENKTSQTHSSNAIND